MSEHTPTMQLVLEYTLHSEGFPPGSNGLGPGKDNMGAAIRGWSQRAHLEISIGMCISPHKDNWQGVVNSKSGLKENSSFTMPCLKDRRDETPGFNGLWFPVSRGLNKKPLLQPLQECCRPGWNHAGRDLPSRRNIKPGAVLTIDVAIHSLASGKNLHHSPGGVFFSQSGASAPVMITAVRGDGVIYNPVRNNILNPKPLTEGIVCREYDPMG